MKIDIVKHEKLWLGISIVTTIVAITLVAAFRLRLGIDFTGGTVIEYQFSQAISKDDITSMFTAKETSVERIVESEDNTYLVYTKPIAQEKVSEILTGVKEKYSDAEQKRVETVGPSVGKELSINAFKSIGFVSFAIILYLAYSFRKVKKPLSSWSFGVCAVLAMVHDILVVLGAFAVFGKVFGAEVDTLFVTAILTIIGFSVHDTIVVFDRIRENITKYNKEDFKKIVNFSLVETLGRSINLSLTVIITLIALLILGGISIRWFVAALLVGMISGTYSSIFVASQALLAWEDIKSYLAKLKKRNKKIIGYD